MACTSTAAGGAEVETSSPTPTPPDHPLHPSKGTPPPPPSRNRQAPTQPRTFQAKLPAWHVKKPINVTPFQPGCCAIRHGQRKVRDLLNAMTGTATAAAATAACGCCAAGSRCSGCGCAREWAGAGRRWLRGLGAGSVLQSSAGTTADYAAARIQLHACMHKQQHHHAHGAGSVRVPGWGAASRGGLRGGGRCREGSYPPSPAFMGRSSSSCCRQQRPSVICPVPHLAVPPSGHQVRKVAAADGAAQQPGLGAVAHHQCSERTASGAAHTAHGEQHSTHSSCSLPRGMPLPLSSSTHCSDEWQLPAAPAVAFVL